MSHVRTQVAIIGAGPAGLLLAQLLSLHGVDSIIVERQTRAYIEARLRAGVLEQGTVDLMTQAGVGERLHREGLKHDGIYLQWPGVRHHLDFPELCGRSVWVYGQTEVVKDLFQAREADGQQIYFQTTDTAIHDVDTDHPFVTFIDADGNTQRIDCAAVAGCDGFHGVSRSAIAVEQQSWERIYPYSWLGILADAPPATDELIYAWHPNGFAMHSMRSATVSRLYLQVDATDDIKNWSDDRIWSELNTRMAIDGAPLNEGPLISKGILPMRSFVSTPMRGGRLFLAGDAAHIVPPTGAKGLNLAASDVAVLATALAALFNNRDESLIDAYSDTPLARVWRATHFSWWMTSMLHTSGDSFDAQLQLSQLRYVASSRAAAESLAENYTGLPFEH